MPKKNTKEQEKKEKEAPQKPKSVLVEEAEPKKEVKEDKSAGKTKKIKAEVKEVVAQTNYLRITPRKTALVSASLKGLSAEEAIRRLSLMNKAAASPVKKLIQSGLANAKNNFNISAEDLLVKNIIVGQGPSLKRFQPAAFGTAHRYVKRSSHLKLILAVKTEPTSNK